MSFAIDIADAVVDLLNGAAPGTFVEAFTAKRRFVPTFVIDKGQDLEADDLSVMRVEVIVPTIQTIERGDRDDWHEQFPIVLGIAKKLTAGDREAREVEMAVLSPIVEQIVDYLRDSARVELVISGTPAVLGRVEPMQNFDAEVFSEKHTFMAVVALYYRLYR